MLRHCYEVERIKKIFLGSGGSAFVDGGLGAMYALGAFDMYLTDGTKVTEVPTLDVGMDIE